MSGKQGLGEACLRCWGQGQDAPAGPLAGLAQRCGGRSAGLIVGEDALPAVAPGHDMVMGSGELETQAFEAWPHESLLAGIVKKISTDPVSRFAP